MQQQHTIENKTELFRHVVEKVPCPRCQVPRGDECRSRNGRCTEPHLDRHAAHVEVCSE